MTKLSVVILTKNEERNIQACLDSVRGWADEIVLVDDESTDGTIVEGLLIKPVNDIARKYTDKILIRKMDIEGRHSNFAYARAVNPWVLSLDADERPSNELKKEISEILNQETNFNGFTIPRRNYIGDYWVRHGGWYPSSQLKLFRKDKFRYEEVGVHPRAFMDDPCGHLKSDIIHFSYKNLEDFLSKMNNQTTREAQKWFNQHKPMRLGRFTWRTCDRFMRAYIGRKGYRDGFIGFAVAFFAGLYQFLSYLKYREIILSGKKPGS